MNPPNLQDALEERGFQALFCIGHGESVDGQEVIKIAANPGIRILRNTRRWLVMRHIIIEAIDKLMESELDDLEIEA